MIERVLESEGFDVTAVADAQLALDLLEREFDAVVLDLQMPGLDGRGLFRAMRSRGYEMPVLLLSAYGARSAARELGADASMEKPFDIDELIERIHRMIAASARPRLV